VTRAGIDQPVFTELAAGTGFKKIMRTFSPGGWGIALTCFALLYVSPTGSTSSTCVISSGQGNSVLSLFSSPMTFVTLP
jgi:hypothetical protein